MEKSPLPCAGLGPQGCTSLPRVGEQPPLFGSGQLQNPFTSAHFPSVGFVLLCFLASSILKGTGVSKTLHIVSHAAAALCYFGSSAFC